MQNEESNTHTHTHWDQAGSEYTDEIQVTLNCNIYEFFINN